MTEKEFNQLLESLELDEEQLELISGGFFFDNMTQQEFLKILKVPQEKQNELYKKYGKKNGLSI